MQLPQNGRITARLSGTQYWTRSEFHSGQHFYDTMLPTSLDEDDLFSWRSTKSTQNQEDYWERKNQTLSETVPVFSLLPSRFHSFAVPSSPAVMRTGSTGWNWNIPQIIRCYPKPKAAQYFKLHNGKPTCIARMESRWERNVIFTFHFAALRDSSSSWRKKKLLKRTVATLMWQNKDMLRNLACTAIIFDDWENFHS